MTVDHVKPRTDAAADAQAVEVEQRPHQHEVGRAGLFTITQWRRALRAREGVLERRAFRAHAQLVGAADEVG
jgi:hypothetical protein